MTHSDSDNPEFPNLQEINQSLAENENLSEHNKKILDDFFEEWRDKVTDSTLGDYSSQWNRLAEEINFPIDEAEREDVIGIVKKISRDKIRKQNGGKYSQHSKEKALKALSVFYRQFISFPGRGYVEKMDGPNRVRGAADFIDSPNDSIIKETKLSPSQVKQVADAADSLRNRAIILFGWAVGCRIGEVFPTDDKPQPLLWKDIQFGSDDSMSVRLRENRKKRDGPNRRTVNVVVSRPIMWKLYQRRNPDPDEPVFLKKRHNLFCPDCRGKVKTRKKSGKISTSSNRDYECRECSWSGTSSDVVREKKPVNSDRVRDIVSRTVKRSGVSRVDRNPHAVFRKSRALHKQAMNWAEGGMRSFFGWAENSTAPAKYKEALRVNQKQNLNEEHPELDINVEGRFYDESLKPTKCNSCGELNSRIWDFCRNCDHQLTFEGLVMTEEDPESERNRVKHEVKNWGIEYLLDKSSVDEETFKDRLADTIDEKVDEI